MIIDVITIFPDMFSPVLGESIIKRAVEKGLAKINVHNLRDYSRDKHKKIDDAPYGGGPGMLFKAEPFFNAVESILGCGEYNRKNKDAGKRIVLLGPRGRQLNQKIAVEFLNYERIILLAPRYEGVDERVAEYLADEEISIGDYILSGAELAAMVFIDAIMRLIPGVVSDMESIKKESFEGDSLDYPHYTRPEDFRGLKVPEVLLSGNHRDIEQWRKKTALETTKKYRPDLLKESKQ